MLNFQNVVCDETAYAKWEERYKERLRQAVQNGVDYLSPMLVGDYEGTKITVIFSDGMSKTPENRYLKVVFSEPHIDEKSRLPVHARIFISEEDRPSDRFHKKKY